MLKNMLKRTTLLATFIALFAYATGALALTNHCILPLTNCPISLDDDWLEVPPFNGTNGPPISCTNEWGFPTEPTGVTLPDVPDSELCPHWGLYVRNYQCWVSFMDYLEECREMHEKRLNNARGGAPSQPIIGPLPPRVVPLPGVKPEECWMGVPTNAWWFTNMDLEMRVYDNVNGWGSQQQVTTNELYWDWPTNSTVGYTLATTNGIYTNAGWGWVKIRIPSQSSRMLGSPFMLASYQLKHFFGINIASDQGTNWWTGMLPHGASFAFYDLAGETWRPFVYDWTVSDWRPNGNVTNNLGTGGLVCNATTEDWTVLLCGHTVVGQHTNPLPAGWSVASHINGKEGYLDDLDFPADANTIVKRWIDGAWVEYRATNTASTTLGKTRWNDGTVENSPYLEPGEAIFVYQSSTKDWIQHGHTLPGLPSQYSGEWLSVAPNGSELWVTVNDTVLYEGYTIEKASSLTGSWSYWNEVESEEDGSDIGVGAVDAFPAFFRNSYGGNDVGAYQVTVPAGGYYVAANHLDNRHGNLVADFDGTPPDGALCWTLDQTWSKWEYDTTTSKWIGNGTPRIAPGKAAYFYNPSQTAWTLTFWGEVREGSLTNAIPSTPLLGNAKALLGNLVPVAESVTTANVPTVDGLTVSLYLTSSPWWDVCTFDELEEPPAWLPSATTMNLGQGGWFNSPSATNWTRSYTAP